MRKQLFFKLIKKKKEFIFPQKFSQDNFKSNTQDLTTSKRFLVLVRGNASDLQPPSLTIDLQE